MVSTENLNRDVLELIFSHLNSNDLCSVTLVSRSFFAAAISQLYRTLFFHREQTAVFPATSPFATVVAHPAYAVYVRVIDVRFIPLDEFWKHRTDFTRQFAKAVKLCKNLKSFTCMTSGDFCFLLYLANKTGLSELRVDAYGMSDEQATRLTSFRAIQSLLLFESSLNVMNMLPGWSRSIQHTLTSLVLYYCDTLNDEILESVLINLPQLVVLRIVCCSSVSSTSILRLSKHTPMLRSLAMSLSSHLSYTSQPTILVHLRELTLEMLGVAEAARANFTSFVPYLRKWLPPLSSIHLRSATAMHRSSILELLEDHATTLKCLAFHIPLEVASIMAVCSSCLHLEELAMPFLVGDFTAFATAIRSLKCLRTLNNTRPPFSLEPDPPVTSDQVTHLLSICQSLQNVTSGKKSWTGYIDAQGRIQTKVQRHDGKDYWMVPLRYLR